jgi:signal peptidase I
MSDNTQLPSEIPKRRWVGVLLSLLVPGFGLIRCGRIKRGVVWYLLSYVLGYTILLIEICRSIPFWLVVAALIFSVALHITMLVDSFRPGKMNKTLWVFFSILLIADLIIPSKKYTIGRAFTVPTSSMEPTLLGKSHGTEDHIIADRLSYIFTKPKRGDLLVFSTKGLSGIKEDTFWVKRLVGLPGEKIEIHNGRLFADGRQLTKNDGIPDFNYTLPPEYLAQRSKMQNGSFLVPPNSYFVLGDNPDNSSDSRYWGALPSPNIYGRVARIYYPFARTGIRFP